MSIKERFDALRSIWRKTPDSAPSEATLAKQRAEMSLRQTEAQTAYYAELGESLKNIREANHLTELFFTNRTHHTVR